MLVNGGGVFSLRHRPVGLHRVLQAAGNQGQAVIRRDMLGDVLDHPLLPGHRRLEMHLQRAAEVHRLRILLGEIPDAEGDGRDNRQRQPPRPAPFLRNVKA